MMKRLAYKKTGRFYFYEICLTLHILNTDDYEH